MPNQYRPRVSSHRRAFLFRLAAVCLGLTPMLFLEVVLWGIGIGAPRYDHDPFVGFRAIHPLFVLSDDGDRYEIAESRLDFFRSDSFAAEKAPNEFRVFCLGGSTVQGRPYSIESSFTTFLELSLRAAEPERQWEVVNCGGISYASYRLVPILEEILQNYEPDLIILYTGHNEFLEDRTYGHVKRLPEAVAQPLELLANTRTYRTLHVLWQGEEDTESDSGRNVPGRPVLADEVEAMLEFRGGLDRYRRDNKWRRDVIAHFEYNLGRMVALARNAKVPLLLANPVCSLRHCSPFKNQHRDGLTTAQLQRWENLVAQANDRRVNAPAEAVRLLEKAMEIDDKVAGLRYSLAETYDSMGNGPAAKGEYIAAKEHDICPLRILEAMNRVILRTASASATPLVDVRHIYEEFSEDGIPGGKYLVDHVHPSIEGHQLIADLIASKLAILGIVHPCADWRERRNKAYQAQLDTFDALYYAKGQQRLDVLRCWTQGKAGENWSYEGEKPVFRAWDDEYVDQDG